MAQVLGDPGAARCLDLGSGAGLPGLPLALRWPATSWALLESGGRRCAALREAVAALALGARVVVVEARAEEAGRDPDLRATFDLVTARAFGAPAVTAECGAPFLRAGGRLAVSEPPAPAPARWPSTGLAQLGLAAAAPVAIGTVHLQVLEQRRPCPDRFPRRTGVPAKRPLF